MFKLKRENPVKMEIEITPQQLISMFPIEIQEHPYMGEIERMWKTDNQIFSINEIDENSILDLTKQRKHLQVKNEKMMEILQQLNEFQIVLFYENKKDIYDVKRID